MMAEAARFLSSSDSGNVVSTSSLYQTSICQQHKVGETPSCMMEEGNANNREAILPVSGTTAERYSLPLHTNGDNVDRHSKLIPDPSYYPKDILELLAQNKASGTFSESTWIHVLDSGGQPQFADVSRAFIHGNLVNIIVLKLTQRLDDLPPFSYSIDGKQLSQPAALQMTYIQLIQSFVRSIVSSKYTVHKGIRKEYMKPLFFIVGTYLDHIYGVKGFFKSIETLQEKNRQLVHALREYKEHLVFYNECDEELIFPVNNLCRWSREKISSDIRRRITCSNKPAATIKIPIRWYLFEIKVKEESLKVAHGMVTLDSCIEIGIKLGMGKQEVSQCIDYLNSFNLFLYFPVLPHVVFTNPQYLLDMVTSLIRVSFIDYPNALLAKGFVLPPGTQRELKRKGLFSEQLLDYLCLEFIPNVFTKDNLIELLQCLFIIAPVRKTAPPLYFLPSALPTYLPSEKEKKTFSQTCEPLLILFKNKVLPQGLFSALVVALLRRTTYPCFTLHNSIQQLRYAIHFDSDLDGSVGLMDCHNWLEIYYTGLPGISCRNILQTICEVLPSCADVLCYDESVAHVVPTLRCQNKHIKSMPPHPAKVSYVGGNVVAKCTEDPTLPPIQLSDKRYVSWFEKEDVQVDSRSNEVRQPIQISPKLLIHETPEPHISTSDTRKGDTFPCHILKKHTSELLGIISDPDKLATDLWSADLIPYSVRDNVLTTLGLSRFQKANMLLDEVYRYLKVIKTTDILVKFCEVLKIQHDPGITKIAEEILKQLSEDENIDEGVT